MCSWMATSSIWTLHAREHALSAQVRRLKFLLHLHCEGFDEQHSGLHTRYTHHSLSAGSNVEIRYVPVER